MSPISRAEYQRARLIILDRIEAARSQKKKDILKGVLRTVHALYKKSNSKKKPSSRRRA